MARRPAPSSSAKDLAATRREQARAKAALAQAGTNLEHLDRLTVAQLEGLRNELARAVRPEHAGGNAVVIEQLKQIQAEMDSRDTTPKKTTKRVKTRPLAIVPEPEPLTPLRTCEHAAVEAHADDTFRYRCIACATLFVSKPEGAAFITPQADSQPPATTLVEDAAASIAAPVPATPASPLDAKIAYLRSLLADDKTAELHEALRLGLVKVRVPGEAARGRTRVRARAPGQRRMTKKVFPPELVAAVRAARAEGLSYKACEERCGIAPDKGRTAWTICNVYDAKETVA
jgi:hypothetical protein